MVLGVNALGEDILHNEPNFHFTEAAISLRLGRILPGVCWCPSKQSIYVAGPCLNVVFTQCLLFPNGKHRWQFLFLKIVIFKRIVTLRQLVLILICCSTYAVILDDKIFCQGHIFTFVQKNL